MKQPRFYLLGDSSANNPSAISKTQIELWESEGIIEYLGVCDDVRGIIEACDCVVLPSYKEGAPRILLEAMALSKPIITTDTAGCKECVKAPLNCHNGVLLGENGIVVPLKDSLALKEAICYLCENPHLLKSMGESGAEFAKRFDVRGVVEIYKKAISNANSPLTQDTRIFSNANDGETQGDSVDSMESNKINPHEVRTNSRSASWCIKRGVKEAEVPPLFLCKKRIKARLSPKSVPKAYERSEVKTAAAFLCVGERGGGAALFAKKSDYINKNISIESRRIERVESQTKSFKDSAFSSDFIESNNEIDCHEFNKLNSRNDDNDIDSHEAFTTHNDDSAIDSHDNPYKLSRNGEHIADYHKSQGDSNDDNSMAIPHKDAKSPKHSPTKALAFISNTCFGMWNFRLPVLKSLQKDGFVVHILAPTDNSRAKLENEGFFVHSISIDSKGLNPLKDIKTAMQIYKILSTIKPSVVFSYTIKCVIYGSFVANMLKIPNIAIITGLGYVFIGQSARKKILQNIVSKMYAIALRKTKSVWFLNNDDKSEFIKRHIIAESKSFLLNSEGVDLEHFSPKCGVKSGILPDRIEGEIRFILIARMLWDKGVGEFVEAARKIVDSTTAMGGG